jgi:hypothetical protein
MISNVVICETNNHKYLFLVGPIEKWREVFFFSLLTHTKTSKTTTTGWPKNKISIELFRSL